MYGQGLGKATRYSAGLWAGRSGEVLPSRSEQMRFSGVGFLIMAGGLVEGGLS